MKTKDITLIALMAALICIAGPVVVPVGPIPLSLASFAVYLAGAVLGPKKGSLAVVVYLLIGMIGIPVFSGFSGGLQKLVGVTGGYLIGYIPCAFISGLAFAKKIMYSYLYVALCMIAGTLVLYALGTAWFVLQTGNTISAALMICVVPFLPGDAVKIVSAVAISLPVKHALLRASDVTGKA